MLEIGGMGGMNYPELDPLSVEAVVDRAKQEARLGELVAAAGES